MEQPTRGQQRCMIYAYHRQLPDGCDNCRLSLNACHATTELNRQRCCPACTHG